MFLRTHASKTFGAIKYFSRSLLQTKQKNKQQRLCYPSKTKRFTMTFPEFSLKGGKEMILVCMDVAEYSRENIGGSVTPGYKVKCYDCQNYSKFFTKRQGLGNALNHWYACVKSEGPKIYKERCALKLENDEDDKRGSISKEDKKQLQFSTITNWHRSIYMWIEKIVKLNQPVSIVENAIERNHVKYPDCKSTKTVLDTAFHLVEIVEKKIAEMMRNSPGCQVVYDAWTRYGVHFLGIYASFMQKCSGTDNIHQCRLLALSPMSSLTSCTKENIMEDASGDESMEDTNDDNHFDEEAIKFDAEHHKNHITNTFEYYEKQIDFVLCQLADSASVCIKVANLLGIPHDSCKNHNLSLQCNKMIKGDTELEEVTAKLGNLASKVRASSKASTALRNALSGNNKHSSVRAKKKSVTRAWVGHELLLSSHIRLHQHLGNLIHDKVAKLDHYMETVEKSYINKIKKHQNYLSQIRKVSTYLQTFKLPLHKAQGALDILMHKVRRGQYKPNSVYHSCKLGTDKIIPDNGLSTSCDFETGVAKIQQGVVQENTMTSDEMEACKLLLKECCLNSVTENVESEGSEEEDEDIYKAIATEEERKKNEVMNHSKYINCTFIMGSTAIVEQLWSKAGCVFNDRRAGLSPLVLEMIMFLKDNHDLWSIVDVMKADDMRKAAGKESRANKKIEENIEIEAILPEF